MNTSKFKKFVILCSGALASAAVLFSPLPLQSGEPAEEPPGAEKMLDSCRKIKEQKQKIQEDIKAQNAELSALARKMNGAPADLQLDLMAALVTKMIEQKAATDARRAKLEQEMMTHLMQHMQHMQKTGEPKCQCPMMKERKDLKKEKDPEEKSDEDHKEHHPEDQ